MIIHKTREAWLNAVATQILDRFKDAFEMHFGDVGIEHLHHLKVSTGFPSTGGLTSVIGQCWKSAAAEDGTTHHIFINPRLVDVVEVVATLAHEMVHAADDGEHSHSGPFTKAVREIGLEGKPTSTCAGAAFADWVRDELSDKVGQYPHTALVPMDKKKTQTTRMLKLEAACCGYFVRTTKKWIEVGLPSCPCGNEMQEA